ncbi:hypothetical protein ARTHRO9V_200158 [Arthrobacter sp. 9V]|uniref:hypothetical protein n=1 Tax=Arthrobacter sp. 9V TaxID=2653132 RepID=UPI0012F1E9AE|nr:hypothetical protein [Arthrobacter sp. 9V]VXC05905.1 hypothetical protein ARTHRO9V_200158 [Arthrobacter sp. 9V]
MGEQRPWNEDETNALLEAYFEMLDSERRGLAYSKIAHNRHLQSLTGRSKGSIEFKFCNISHVLAEIDHPFVVGYKPRSHVQEALRVAVMRQLNTRDSLIGSWDTQPKSLMQSPTDAPKPAAASNERGPLFEPTAPVMQDDAIWHRLAGLWDRATGGTDVAARPDHPVDSIWPSALRPAGVEEACNWLKAGIAAGEPARFLFLVGGPGAGKSHATAHVVEGLHAENEHDEGLAHRVYEYKGTRSDVVVINDATISLETSNAAPLISDINGAVDDVGPLPTSRPLNLMACVNRGVLVEEMADSRSRESQDWTAGDVLVRWLYGSVAKGPDESVWRLSRQAGRDFVKSAQLSHLGNPVANILAVFVDECSLFEERPAITIGADSRVSAEDYRIVPLARRREIRDVLSPAADLLTNVLTVLQIPDVDARDEYSTMLVNPVIANLHSLRSPQIRTGLLTLARSAELMSATRMTYRELWGFLTRALVGDAPIRMARGNLREFIVANQPVGQSAEDDFQRMQRLSGLRFNQSIFGAGEWASASEGSTRDPVLKLLVPADPVTDAVPGSDPDSPDEGWATPVSDAFSVHASDGTPLQSLLESLPNNSPMRDIVTDFDKRLDEAFSKLMQQAHLKDDKRLDATGWYGAYLTRLYAVSHGISAFRREIEMLITTWVQSPHLPDGLKSPLRTLLRPKRNPNASGSSILPLFDSRTEPITGRVSIPKLAVRVKEPELTTDRAGQGEQVLLTIRTDGTRMSSVSLDFPLIREALACVDDFIGVTDLIDVTAPRLERVRASRLLSAHLLGAEFCLADGDQEVQLTQQEQPR